MTTLCPEVSDELLAGCAAQVAVWLAHTLRGRYAVTLARGTDRVNVWWLCAGGHWAECDDVVPRQAVRYELEHAYYRLAPDGHYSYTRLQRLINPAWVDGTLMWELRRALRVPGDRPA